MSEVSPFMSSSLFNVGRSSKPPPGADGNGNHALFKQPPSHAQQDWVYLWEADQQNRIAATTSWSAQHQHHQTYLSPNELQATYDHQGNYRIYSNATHNLSLQHVRREAEMKVQNWLKNIKFEEYTSLFVQAGYDMPTISRMTPEDLTAIGITKPAHRRKLKSEIQRLKIDDGVPSYRPDSLLEWLALLRLEEYMDVLCSQGYDSIDRVAELTWEDLEEIGIKKLGHEKRLMLAIKRVRDLRRHSGAVSSISSSDSSSASSVSSGSCPDVTRSSLLLANSFYHLQSPTNNFQAEEVAINTSTTSNRTSKVSPSSPAAAQSTTGEPTTPAELKTFQPSDEQLNKNLQQHQSVQSMNGDNNGHRVDGYQYARQMSESAYGRFVGGGGHDQHNGQYGLIGIAPRNRSMTNLEMGDNPWAPLQQRYPAHGSGHEIYASRQQVGGQKSVAESNGESMANNSHKHHYQNRAWANNSSNGQVMHQQSAQPAMGYEEQSSNSHYQTEDGLVSTLHRPKEREMPKVKPVAKIPAKTRQLPDSSFCFESIQEIKLKNNSTISLEEQTLSAVKSAENGNDGQRHTNNHYSTGYASYRSQSSELGQFQPPQSPAHSIYATLKRRKTPPKPPQRTNSMKSGSNGYSLNLSSDLSCHSQSHTMATLPARCSSLEAMQEQAFVTCVQSLTSRFSRISSGDDSPDQEQPAPPVPWRNHSITPRVPSPQSTEHPLPPPTVEQHSSNEFPPPPPWLEGNNGYDDYTPEPAPPVTELDYNTLSRRPTNFGGEEHIMSSSSSSTESMPFANDNPNVATIKQRVSSTNHSQVTTPVREFPPPLSSVMSAPPSVATSPSATLMWPRKQLKLSLLSPSPTTCRPNSSTHHALVHSTTHSSPPSSSSPAVTSSNGWDTLSPSELQRTSRGDVIEDIETMLANLSNQLDAMLEKKVVPD